MTNPFKPYFFFLVTALLLSACTEDVDTTILLNAKSYPSSPIQPDMSDKTGYYEVILAGAMDIIAVDRSTPSEAVKKRKWVLEGPGIKLEQQDSASLNFKCKQPGWYSVYLEINGQTEHASTSWILAKGSGIVKAVSTPNAEPSFKLLYPKEEEITTTERSMVCSMRTSLYKEAELDGIKVFLNDKPVTNLMLNADEELTTARLNLRKGKNTVEIKAEIGGEEFEESFVVERETPLIADHSTKKNTKSTTDNKVEKTVSKPSSGGGSKANPAVSANATKAFEGKKIEKLLLDLEKVADCAETCGSKQNIQIKADRPIQLRKIHFAPTSCGYYHYKLMDGAGTVVKQRKNNALSAFPTGITLHDEVLGEYIPQMKQGETWTLELELETSGESCSEQPLIKSLSNCGLESTETKQLTLLNGKPAIYKIDYTY